MPKHLWQPGQSGNPQGIRRGPAKLAKLVQAATREGAELIEFLLQVFRDEMADPKSRQWACDELLCRGFGKSATPLELSVEGGPVHQLRFDKLSDEELIKLHELSKKAELPADAVE